MAAEIINLQLKKSYFFITVVAGKQTSLTTRPCLQKPSPTVSVTNTLQPSNRLLLRSVAAASVI